MEWELSLLDDKQLELYYNIKTAIARRYRDVILRHACAADRADNKRKFHNLIRRASLSYRNG